MNLLPLLIPLQAQADESPFSIFGSGMFPMIAIFMIFYFLLIRPQQKRQKEQAAMIKSVEKGDDVVTVGGLHGKVVGVSDDTLTLEIAVLKGERVRVKLERGKVESVKKGDAS
jgi:preprotein translocase subunit YajC